MVMADNDWDPEKGTVVFKAGAEKLVEDGDLVVFDDPDAGLRLSIKDGELRYYYIYQGQDAEARHQLDLDANESFYIGLTWTAEPGLIQMAVDGEKVATESF